MLCTKVVYKRFLWAIILLILVAVDITTFVSADFKLLEVLIIVIITISHFTQRNDINCEPLRITADITDLCQYGYSIFERTELETKRSINCYLHSLCTEQFLLPFTCQDANWGPNLANLDWASLLLPSWATCKIGTLANMGSRSRIWINIVNINGLQPRISNIFWLN